MIEYEASKKRPQSEIEKTDTHAKIREYLCWTKEDVHKKFIEVKKTHYERRLTLPPGHVAACAVPRTRDNNLQSLYDPQSDLQIPEVTGGLFKEIVRHELESRGALMNYGPQAELLHPEVGTYIKNFVKEWFRHLRETDPNPEKKNLAQEIAGVPMLLGRVDMIGKEMYITEIDGSCSLWSTLSEFNPIAESYMDALRKQLADRGRPLHLVEHKDKQAFRTAYITKIPGKKVVSEESYAYRRSKYPHLDHMILPELPPWFTWRTEDVSTITRGKPGDHGFQQYIDQWGPTTIFLRENRDFKDPLVAMGHAVLAPNLQIALDGAEAIINDPTLPDKKIVICSIEDSRTEALAIFTAKGTKRPGESSRTAIEKKLPKDQLTLVIPFVQPTSMEDEGFRFWGERLYPESGLVYEGDAAIVTKGHEGYNKDAGKKMKPGREKEHRLCRRTFFSIEPDKNAPERTDPDDIDITIMGGIAQARESAILHGTPDAMTWGSYLVGLPPHPDIEVTDTSEWAWEMVQRNAHLVNGPKSITA